MFEASGPAELIARFEDAHRRESQLMAEKLATVWDLLVHRVVEYDTDPDPDYASISGFQRASAEVAAAMNLSPRAASFMVFYADTLATRLPKVAAVLAEGQTDWRTVELIINRTEPTCVRRKVPSRAVPLLINRRNHVTVSANERGRVVLDRVRFEPLEQKVGRLVRLLVGDPV